MAISYQEVKGKYEEKMNAPLSVHELNEIKKIEEKIDEFIKSSFKDEPIVINISIVQFSEFPPRRAALMRRDLEKRYEDVGWKVGTYSTDDDGPNRPGLTYWQLKGKNFK